MSQGSTSLLILYLEDDESLTSLFEAHGQGQANPPPPQPLTQPEFDTTILYNPDLPIDTPTGGLIEYIFSDGFAETSQGISTPATRRQLGSTDAEWISIMALAAMSLVFAALDTLTITLEVFREKLLLAISLNQTEVQLRIAVSSVRRYFKVIIVRVIDFTNATLEEFRKKLLLAVLPNQTEDQINLPDDLLDGVEEILLGVGAPIVRNDFTVTADDGWIAIIGIAIMSFMVASLDTMVVTLKVVREKLLLVGNGRINIIVQMRVVILDIVVMALKIVRKTLLAGDLVCLADFEI